MIQFNLSAKNTIFDDSVKTLRNRQLPMPGKPVHARFARGCAPHSRSPAYPAVATAVYLAIPPNTRQLQVTF